MKKPVRILALQDIASYIRKEKITIRDGYGDFWYVTANRLDCIEQRKLNKELGISKVNMARRRNKRRLRKININK